MEVKTFVFSELSKEDKEKFMEFMLNNDFEFVKND